MTDKHKKRSKSKIVAVVSGAVATIAVCAIAICLLSAPQVAPSTLGNSSADTSASSGSVSGQTPSNQAASTNNKTSSGTNTNAETKTASTTTNKNVFERIVDTITNNNTYTDSANNTTAVSDNTQTSASSDNNQNAGSQTQNTSGPKLSNCAIGTSDDGDTYATQPDALCATNSANEVTYATIYWGIDDAGYKTLYIAGTQTDDTPNTYNQKSTDLYPAWFTGKKGEYAFNDQINEISIENTVSPVSLRGWFGSAYKEGYCFLSSLEEISGLDYINTSNVVDASFAFAGVGNCQIDPEIFETGVTVKQQLDMSNMTSLVNAQGMFAYSTYIPTTTIKTSDKLTNTRCMYQKSSLSTLDATNFNLTSCTDASFMFFGCDKLTSITGTNFKTNALANAAAMFNSTALKQIDISDMTLTNTADITSMFRNSQQLTTIAVASGTDWSDKSYKVGKNLIFQDCASLKGGAANPTTYYGTSNPTTTYARVDGGADSATPGYFRAKTEITLDSKGGTGGTEKVEAITGEAMPAITSPTRTGYTFNGYFDQETSGTQYYNADGTSAGNWDKTSATATLHAQWSSAVIAVTSVTMNKNATSIYAGSSETLTATIEPDNATYKTLTWTSSNNDVATVDQSGKVTGIKEGSATITATAHNNVSATCTVTVNPKIAVTGVSLDKTSTTITPGYSETLLSTVSPAEATDKTLTWASSDTNIATVDANGKVTAKAAGTVDITATSKDDSSKSATCSVTVEEPIGIKITAQKDGTEITFGPDEYEEYDYENDPENRKSLKYQIVTAGSQPSDDWEDYAGDWGWEQTTHNLNAGDSVYISGKVTTLANFSLSSNIPYGGDSYPYDVYGSFTKVLDDGVGMSSDNPLPENCFSSFFSDDDYYSNIHNLRSISEDLIPFTYLGKNCYYQMFKDLEAITKAPQIPATEFPEGCCCQMFYGCTSLTIGPSALGNDNTNTLSSHSD